MRSILPCAMSSSSALDDAARSPSIGAVVITGSGGAFCAGGDLAGFDELHDARLYRHVSHELTALLDMVDRLEKPVIAVIDGVATGAGLTLALCCDWRIATVRAKLLFREGRLGLVATHGGISRLVKLIGLARAKEALLGGDDLDATAALRLGLVTEIADGDPIAAAHARAHRMLRRAPLSFGATKRFAHLAADADLRSGILAESLAQAGAAGVRGSPRGSGGGARAARAGVRRAADGDLDRTRGHFADDRRRRVPRADGGPGRRRESRRPGEHLVRRGAARGRLAHRDRRGVLDSGQRSDPLRQGPSDGHRRPGRRRPRMPSRGLRDRGRRR